MAISRKRNRGVVGAVVMCGLRGLAIVTVLGTLVPSLALAEAGTVQDAARCVPADTIVLAGVSNVAVLTEKFKSSNTYRLYKDPAMEPFISEVEPKIRDKIKEALDELWSELELDSPPEELPRPTGRVAFAVRMRTTTRTIRALPDGVDYSEFYREGDEGQEFDYEAMQARMVDKEITVPEPQMVGWAEFGEHAESARELAEKLSGKAMQEGSRLEQESVYGVDLAIVREKEDGDQDDSGSDEDELVYGFRESMLIIGSNRQFVKDVLARMAGEQADTLAENESLKAIMSSVGDGDAWVFCNIPAIVEISRTNSDANSSAKFDNTMRQLGVSNLTGLGAAATMCGTAQEELSVKAVLGIRGEPVGIPAMLTPTSMNAYTGRLLTKDVMMFVVGNYDLGQMYDQLGVLVSSMTDGSMNPMMMLEGSLAMTGDPAQERPPVSLREDILGQLRPPMVLTARLEKPYVGDVDPVHLLFAISLRDSERLDAAVRRVHGTFVARGDTELQRDFLNTTLYLMPADMMSEMPFGLLTPPTPGGQDGASGPKEPGMAIAVTSDYLLVGAVSEVEQAIRELRNDRLENIAGDPMYQYASRYLPGRAGIFWYVNEQANSEASWAQMKQAGRLLDERRQSGESDDDMYGEDMEEQLSTPAGSMAWFLSMLGLAELLDLDALPDFEAVRDYFGASVGHVTSRDGGLCLELKSLKPPTALVE